MDVTVKYGTIDVQLTPVFDDGELFFDVVSITPTEPMALIDLSRTISRNIEAIEAEARTLYNAMLADDLASDAFERSRDDA